MVEKLFEYVRLVGRSARLTFWLNECGEPSSKAKYNT
jgi:hypothetical protein